MTLVADIKGHLPLGAIILSVVGEILGSGSPFSSDVAFLQ